MKKLAFVALAMFVLVFALGCTGGKKETSGVGSGYTLSVTPTELITNGTTTIDLRLENVFDKDMTNVQVWLKDVSHSAYQIDGEQNGTNKIGTIMPKQTYPVIMSLTSERAGTISGKHIEVCFEYDTEYYFDIGMKSKKQASEVLSVESGASSGPLSVSATGFENIFYENGKGTGTLSLANNWIGKISKINSISAEFPTGGDLTSGLIAISGCTSTATTNAKLDGTDTDKCGILSNDVAIANGLTLRAEVNVNKLATTSTVERTQGNVNYTYCYQIEMPTITISSV